MRTAMNALSRQQQGLLDRWLPGAVLEQEHSWGLVDRAVLEVTHDGERYIVKAGGVNDHHMRRELHAHREWLKPWTATGRAPQLVHFHASAHLLVTRYLPGELVQGTAAADDPETYRQAGVLLRLLHAQDEVLEVGYEARENLRSLAWLDQPHRIAADLEKELRAEIAGWPTPPAVLVPTHGDWQPRNWLVHDGVVRVIDFGRAALRPAMSDLARLAAQDFRRNPELEPAFLEGYGSDPREPRAWHRNRVREAISTAVWAYQVGEEAFEAQGHRMILDALSEGSQR